MDNRSKQWCLKVICPSVNIITILNYDVPDDENVVELRQIITPDNQRAVTDKNKRKIKQLNTNNTK